MKNRIMACAAAALLVLTSASVWEGAASIAPAGELPDEGYYAATNSFPRNTVVDILNLETGKSIRVIVASGLETPGLLAVLSREAAETIGLRPRSIGRIRMTQPSDPVAFSRFTEGRASNGDPDYDPQALVAADPRASALLDGPGAGESPSGHDPASETEASGAGGSGYSDGEYDEIVDISGFYNPPAASPEDEGIIREPGAAWVYTPEDNEITGEDGYPEEIPEAGALAEVEDKPEALEPPIPPETALTGEAELPETREVPGEEPAGEVHIAGEPDAPEPEKADEESYDYSLVPAEQRPPEEYPEYTLPPEAEIASLPERRDPEETAGTEVLDESLFVAPIERAAGKPDSERPIADPPGIPPVIQPELFSVPLIISLERGKYYLQLGAFSRPELAELELTRIGKTYPLAIQNGGSAEKPVYRVLVGPINLGESGALLQRFKSIGYRDAFVRTGS
jgi:hypothetical protein